jgi:hypothetical protein
MAPVIETNSEVAADDNTSGWKQKAPAFAAASRAGTSG